MRRDSGVAEGMLWVDVTHSQISIKDCQSYNSCTYYISRIRGYASSYPAQTSPMMETCKVLHREEILASLPPPVAETSLAAEIKQLRSRDSTALLPILVVLDDDPTGTQTCHDINVLTVWDEETLLDEFK